MSHFITAVFVPALVAANRDSLIAHLNEHLEEFNENREVEEYDRECYCIGQIARNEARARADSEFGTIQEIRAAFSSTVLPDGRVIGDMQQRCQDLLFSKGNPEDNDESDALDKELDALWKAHASNRFEAEERYFNEHPLKDAPDPTCGYYTGERKSWWPEDVTEGDRIEGDGCGGTGTYRSTYNPDSKWDWWVIGGRWNGWLAPPEAKPENNPDNWKVCWLCQGGGLRNDELGVRMRQSDPEYTCNGCNGTGKQLAWPTEQKDSGYNVVTPKYIESLGMLGELPTPYSFVDLDGFWHQKGDMGWWGMSSNEKDRDAWVQEWREALAEISDPMDGFRVVVVDMHI